jgi:hypothetical protein
MLLDSDGACAFYAAPHSGSAAEVAAERRRKEEAVQGSIKNSLGMTLGLTKRMGALVNRSQRAITIATLRRAVMASDSRVMLNYRGSKSIRKLFPLFVWGRRV